MVNKAMQTAMTHFRPFTLRLRDGQLLEARRPLVMGIVNVTPDSFYAGSRVADAGAVEERVRQMILEGADMIDLGAYSSRPGAADVSEAEELERLARGLEAVRRAAPDVVVSVDTFRSRVAREAVERYGADIVNDIGGGTLDGVMFETVAELGVPYVLMHMRGTPATMQRLTDYGGRPISAAVAADLAAKLQALRQMGVGDVIVDPGFGFGKTLEQNYELLGGVGYLAEMLEAPVLVGVSRKSMIQWAVGVDAAGALAGTTCLNTIALLEGASILRVHDVAEARQAVELTGRRLGGEWSLETN